MAKRKASVKYVSPVKTDLLAQKAFFERLRTAMIKLIGDGYFEKIPKITLLKCYNVRYPTVKIELDDRIIVDAKERKKYKEDFNNRLKTLQIETLTGESISYASFLTEGLFVLQVFNHLPQGEFKEQDCIKDLLRPYIDGKWYSSMVWKLYVDLAYYNYTLFDFYKGSVQFVFAELRTVKAGGSNTVSLARVPHQLVSEEIDNVVRPIARLGYLPSNTVEWGQLAFVSAAQLGFNDVVSTEKLPIYIQHHALRRYEERSFDSAGAAFIMLGHRFAFTENHTTVVGKKHTLLAFHAGVHKIGYFVVTHHSDKWILRTFLLLTNEGTPEGEKLKELTAINKIDAKYLKIDTMEAFIHYDIIGDKKLSAIFTEAGCGPLLEYAKFFDRSTIEVKSADSMSKYLFTAVATDDIEDRD
ncbi:hypothetical protein [Sphingobacterium faecale]|uniref:Uncharacterized protein n=1 Tax=Sphingobacterium faecale TaxID=2803775 RepID=A0ABS1R0Q8_9SPHI|nr:hypothetical protein [Sphingobacterium faecale]MBL1408060.1 hypothetical protein [Sphingobacterium faecale]